MKLAAWALKTAIQDRLTVGADAIPWHVYNAAPKEPGYPYVEYQELTISAGVGKKCPNPTIPILFNIWDSDGVSDKGTSDIRVLQIAQDIIDSLTVSVDGTINYITVPNFNVIWQSFKNCTIVPNIDSSVVHGILEVEFKLQEIL